MKNITVFCGSASGNDTVYVQQATALGQMLAQKNIGLVYGGAQAGLMGAVADATLNAGGRVTGVLPVFLGHKEKAHDDLTELIMVDSMHERKMKMHELSDGVIALPGGYGTLEELFEMLTWAQLGLHRKPIGLLNTAGYYDSLKALIKTMTGKGFLKTGYREMLLISDTIEDLFRQMEDYTAPLTDRLITEKTV